MELLYILLVLLALTRAFGEVAVRLGQPALVGELLAGLAIGAVVHQFGPSFPVLSGLGEDPVFGAITELGIFFLMLLAGLELRPSKLARSSGRAVAVAIGGLVLPLLLGIGLGAVFLPASDLKGAQCLFLGVALAITAVPVSAGVLVSLGRLDTQMGRTIVSAAIVDDVLSLLLLAILSAVLESGGLPTMSSLASLTASVVAYFAIAVPFCTFVLPWLGRRVQGLLSDEFEFTGLVLVALGLAVLAELFEMHFLVGAFLGGLFFVRRTIDESTFEDVEAKVRAITSGFLAPIFFASIGLHLQADAVTRAPVFLLVLLLAATVGKVVGSGLPAYLSGMDRRDSTAIGVGMNARGAVELIVADVAFRAGLFDSPANDPIVASMYSAVVVVAIVTTLATPIGLGWLYREDAS